jgi:hypothetical protein
MKKSVLLITFISLCVVSEAKVKVISHYNFGQSGNITFASAPAEVCAEVSKLKLQATGHPLFNAEAPLGKALKGDGSILFNGNGDGYTGTQSVGQADENMIFEVWVKGRTLDHGDGHQNVTRTVVSNGTADSGYTIAQRGKQWVLMTGKSKIVIIGNVVPNQWVHLAAVKNGKEGSVWLNGKQKELFTPVSAIAPGFSIATSLAKKRQSFSGDIYEVRYSTFKNGEFDPTTDFLLDYQKVKEKNKERFEERSRLVKVIESDGPGKETVTNLPTAACEVDWLITPITTPCKLVVEKSKDGITSTFQLNNGLVSRTFYMSDNLACVSFKNLTNDAEYIRAIKPEARIRIDSLWYEIGGLKGQQESAYLLKSWYSQLESGEQAFVLSNVETKEPIKRYQWKPAYHALKTEWPAKGLHVTMTYKPIKEITALKEFEIKINYEIYQGIPVITKWFEVTNNSDKKVVINSFESEVLAINQDQVKRLQVESDFAFAAVNKDIMGSSFVHYKGKLSEDDPYNKYKMPSSTTLWSVDADYNTWATQNQAEDKLLEFQHRNLLLSRLPAGPNVFVTKETPFNSFVTFELVHDSDDKERRSLGYRRMYKKLAPQVTESLLSVYLPSNDPVKIKGMLNQMAELGMERMETIGEGRVSHDNLSESYIAFWKDLADYAKELGIVLGGYELQTASRGRGDEVNCIDPVTGKPGSSFGQSVCIASKWKDSYFGNMWKFYDRTGLMCYNIDGPYHGDICASTTHKYHRGLEDSQWEQWKTQVEVLHECLRRGMRVQVPDWYFLNGSAATGMGYREAAANLTPQQQLLLGRQYIYDGTWYKLPTMGWMHLQLVGPYANDPRIGLLPLAKNIDRYNQVLMQYLASGCQLGILGNEIYDTPETKRMVSKCFDWFREYRDILTSEIIHVSRPNGRDLDCMLHVNPLINRKGMVIVFNPTDNEITKNLKIPLYYTGLKNKVTVRQEGTNPVSCNLNDKEELSLPVSVKAQGTTWFLIGLN